MGLYATELQMCFCSRIRQGRICIQYAGNHHRLALRFDAYSNGLGSKDESQS